MDVFLEFQTAHLLIGGCKRLAVSTPGGVELYKHVVARKDNFIEGLGRDHLDGSRVISWGVFRLDNLFKLSSLQTRGTTILPIVIRRIVITTITITIITIIMFTLSNSR
jgi:hypothetical protein